ncbi:MAG: hypothetical protein KJ556_20785 [Gammaproteobacteria bacterium]|nr:hypothetical protein [Gammaproteobacteria bacterium]
MIDVYKAQQSVRRSGQLWARGLYDSNVCISVTVLGGVFIATADTEHITEHQFRSALTRVYPDHDIRVERQGWPKMGGYWRAEGRPKDG